MEKSDYEEVKIESTEEVKIALTKALFHFALACKHNEKMQEHRTSFEKKYDE